MKTSRNSGGQTLTRADLAEAVMQKIGLPRKESQDMVEFVLGAICGSLERGDGVKLSSFGTFAIRERASGSAVIPRPARKCRSHRARCWCSVPATS